MDLTLPDPSAVEAPHPSRLPPTRVVVFGGAGFIGQAIVQALAAAPGWTPVVATRHPERFAAQHPGIACIRCDATDALAVAAALDGADYAVNATGGSVGAMLAATQAVCAGGQALRRLVHISSMSVYGAATGLVAEDAPLAGRSRYARAKIRSEALVQAFMARGGQAVILRPGIVMAPGGAEWVARIGRLLQAGRIGARGDGGDGLCNLIHARDLADLTRAALLQDGAAGRVFNVGVADPPTWNHVFRTWSPRVTAGSPRTVGPWRPRVEAVAAAPLTLAAKLGIRGLPEPVPPALAALWRQRIQLNVARADSVLGPAATSPAQVLAQCGAWLAQAFVPGGSRL